MVVHGQTQIKSPQLFQNFSYAYFWKILMKPWTCLFHRTSSYVVNVQFLSQTAISLRHFCSWLSRIRAIFPSCWNFISPTTKTWRSQPFWAFLYSIPDARLLKANSSKFYRIVRISRAEEASWKSSTPFQKRARDLAHSLAEHGLYSFLWKVS